MQQAWNAHFAEVLDRLVGHLAEVRLVPALLVDIRVRLQWAGVHGPEQLRRAVQTIGAAMPVTPESTLARALHSGPVDPGLEARSQLRQTLFADAIKGIVDWPGEQAAERISALLANERRVFGPDTGRARPFLRELLISRPVSSRGQRCCWRMAPRRRFRH